MKEMKRALRRHHITRLKRKLASYWIGLGVTLDKQALGIFTSTSKRRSGYWYGNRRKFEGPDLQELSKDDDPDWDEYNQG